MFKRKKLLVLLLICSVLFAFRQADDYFEISKNLEIFSSVYKMVHSDYVDEVKPGDLMKKGIDAMLASLDPYTNFYTESQAEDALIRQSGEYGGIGCRSIRIGENLVITGVSKGMPADKAGMRPGDKVMEINGKSMQSQTGTDLDESLKGAPGSKAVITIERQGKRLSLELLREEIKIRNVSFSAMVNATDGYIRLDHFMAGASAEVKEALLRLKSQGMQHLILDLRDNGGGLLHEAVRIVNLFVGMDQMIVVAKGRSRDSYHEYKTLDKAVDPDIPLVVLINGQSASASEIVSGAIQDLDRGLIVGRNSFGKGLVQNVRPLMYRTQMKITIAKYYIPSGRCIQQLDYGKRNENGKAMAIADSLRKKFRTRNGRTVLDGGGIRPDVPVDLPAVSNIAVSLEKSHLFFDFASQYREQHPEIDRPDSFNPGKTLFMEFKQFVAGKTFSHLSGSETAFKTLGEKLKDERLSSAVEQEYKSLEAALQKAKLAEMDAAAAEIRGMLHTEIARRYYYDDAVFIRSFKTDPDLLAALELFKDKTRYNSLLGVK